MAGGTTNGRLGMTKIKAAPIMILSLVAMPVVAVIVLTLTGSFSVKEPAILGDVAPFEFTERSGKIVNQDTLAGKVWIGSFVFTSCPAQCPRLMAEAQKIQKALRLKQNFRLVTATVDPERDTPDKLQSYAERFSADPYKWLFLRGSYKDTQKFIQETLKMPTEETGEDVIHTSKFVLVDAYSRIRGYYDVEKPVELKALIQDAKKLLKQTL